MPTRKVRKYKARKKRGGSNLVPYHGKRQGKKAWTGFSNWMKKSALPWIRNQIPVAHKYIKDNKLIVSRDWKSNADKIKDIMENAVSLEVPNKVDYESGPNWGTIK